MIIVYLPVNQLEQEKKSIRIESWNVRLTEKVAKKQSYYLLIYNIWKWVIAIGKLENKCNNFLWCFSFPNCPIVTFLVHEIVGFFKKANKFTCPFLRTELSLCSGFPNKFQFRHKMRPGDCLKTTGQSQYVYGRCFNKKG